MSSLPVRGLSFSLPGGPHLHKVVINKIVTPYFGKKNLWPHHHQYNLTPKQAKILLKSVFKKKNNNSYLWSSSILAINNLITPYFFPKNLGPLYLEPFSKEMAALKMSSRGIRLQVDWLIRQFSYKSSTKFDVDWTKIVLQIGRWISSKGVWSFSIENFHILIFLWRSWSFSSCQKNSWMNNQTVVCQFKIFNSSMFISVVT